MVDKSIICKAFDDAISSKHGDYFTRIRGVLKKVTDNKEEYKTLRDDVFQFYLENRHRTTEKLIMKTTDGRFFSTSDNDEDSVYYTDEMEDVAYDVNSDVLYVGHNHPLPNGDSCVQSSADIYSQILELSKYSWTIGKDGFMISKITKEDGLDENKVIPSYRKVLLEHTKKYQKEFKKELDPLKKKYPNWDNPDYLDSDRFNEDSVQYLQKYLCNHSDVIINDINKQWKKDHCRMECYYAKGGR